MIPVYLPVPMGIDYRDIELLLTIVELSNPEEGRYPSINEVWRYLGSPNKTQFLRRIDKLVGLGLIDRQLCGRQRICLVPRKATYLLYELLEVSLELSPSRVRNVRVGDVVKGVEVLSSILTHLLIKTLRLLLESKESAKEANVISWVWSVMLFTSFNNFVKYVVRNEGLKQTYRLALKQLDEELEKRHKEFYRYLYSLYRSI